jgi:signal peptidase II
MRALLAASRIRREKQSASRFVRSLRSRRGEEIGMKYIFFLALPLYALDRVTKYWVLHSIEPDRPIVVVPNFFHLVNITNNGAAFGSFQNNNAFFSVISCLAALFALVLLLARPSQTQPGGTRSVWWMRNVWRNVSLALLLAGVLGNLTDRLLYEHVIDFLLFDLHVPLAHPWPAFNVADSCICIAVVFFIVHSFRAERKTQA